MNITELRNIVKYAQNKPNTILYVNKKIKGANKNGKTRNIRI